MTTIEEEIVPPPWDLHDQLVKLQGYDPTEVVGERRMGAGMAFRDAGTQVADVARIVGEVRLDWDRIGPTKRGEVTGQLNAFIGAVDAALNMDSSRVDTRDETTTWTPDQVRTQRDANETTLRQLHAWFVDVAQPLCVSAPARRAAEDYVRTEMASLSEQEVNELKQTFAELRDQAQEFERMKPIVEAQRELLGASGTAKLSADFEQEAGDHARQWKQWLVALFAWLIVAGVGGVAFIDVTKPPDAATNAQVASHIFLALLVIGLLLFVVRILSLQFRAHRHMEVVARNKANALSTFNRMVAGQEPDVKAVVAAALAQAVFKVDEGIFSDAGSESVTILERVVSPGIDRLKS